MSSTCGCTLALGFFDNSINALSLRGGRGSGGEINKQTNSDEDMCVFVWAVGQTREKVDGPVSTFGPRADQVFQILVQFA